MGDQPVFRDRDALRGWTTRVLKEHDTTMRFRMVNLYDRGTRWLMIGVQHNDLLTGRKFHVRKLPVFSAETLRTYEQSVNKLIARLIQLAQE
jgi:hypothetical protein